TCGGSAGSSTARRGSGEATTGKGNGGLGLAYMGPERGGGISMARSATLRVHATRSLSCSCPLGVVR
ncbi:unnamed protein product, partial [Urochloa humidicola]